MSHIIQTKRSCFVYLFIKLNSLLLLLFCVYIEMKLQELKELPQSTEKYGG